MNLLNRSNQHIFLSCMLITFTAWSAPQTKLVNLPALNVPSISLAKKEMEVFPEVICHVKNLQILYVNDNKLHSIPDCIGNHSAMLNSLHLNNNNLTNLPDTIGELRKLQVLRLEDNEINMLTSNIGQLSVLESLSLARQTRKLSDGKIVYTLTSIPKEVGNLVSLDSLDLSGNKELKFLPDELSNLTNLSSLNLSNCGFEEVPSFLPYLINLDKLNLEGNPLLPAQREAIRQIFEKTRTEVKM